MLTPLDRYFWLLCIVMTFINAIVLRMRARPRIAADPTLAKGYDAISWGFVTWGNIPWIVMGIGCTFGGVHSVFDYLQPHEYNVFVLAWYVTMVPLWALGAYWIFRRGGAEMLIRHPGLFRDDVSSPKLVKWTYLAGVAGGLIAVACCLARMAESFHRHVAP